MGIMRLGASIRHMLCAPIALVCSVWRWSFQAWAAPLLFALRTSAARLSATPPALSSHAPELAHGIDCACYYTDNFFISTDFLQSHFTYHGVERFVSEHTSLLGQLSRAQHTELLSKLETEAERRRGVVGLAVARKRRVQLEYVRLHPELWALREEWLHPEFVRLVRAARERPVAIGSGAGVPAWPGGPKRLCEGVYAVPIFSRRFCELLCEELAAFADCDLPSAPRRCLAAPVHATCTCSCTHNAHARARARTHEVTSVC